jgi:hypothetical protein
VVYDTFAATGIKDCFLSRGFLSVFETFPEVNETRTQTDNKNGVHNSLFSEPQMWENSTVLPVWFKECVALHKEQRLALNETNWKDQRYLIMRCVDIDDRCGGASDRLQSVAALLDLVNMTRRMSHVIYQVEPPSTSTRILGTTKGRPRLDYSRLARSTLGLSKASPGLGESPEVYPTSQVIRTDSDLSSSKL